MTLKHKIVSEERITTINDYLKSHPEFKDLNLLKGISFPKSSKDQKIIPSIQLATLEDAKDISQIFKEVYLETYSYKELEDENEIHRMIIDPNFYWIVFKINSTMIIGCIGFQVDLDNKSGSFHGLVFKKKYQGLTGLVDLLIACLYSILKIYEKKVLVWSCEIRSAHTKSQYSARVLNLQPIAFLPNKDFFFNREESEILYVLYDEDVLTQYRSPEIPVIPHQVLNSYAYSLKKYHIGNPIIDNSSNLNFNKKEIDKIKKRFFSRAEKDKYGNESVSFSLKDSPSNLRFFYNSSISNIEHTTYQASSKEELYVFLEELMNFIKKNNIRYCECFVSAYSSVCQSIFLNVGFEAFGYIPAFKYDKKEQNFKDQVVFVYYQGDINKENLRMLLEPKELVQSIKPLWEF